MLVLALVSHSLIAGNKPVTIDDVARLTKPVPHNFAEVYKVKIESIGTITLKPNEGNKSKYHFGDKFIYPTKYDAPEVTSKKDIPVVPSTPRNFNTAFIGYEVKLSAKRVGSLIYIFGDVERKDFVRFKNSSGELSGEIVSNDRRTTLTKNIINQPVFQTVSSGFVLSALSGKTYEIPVWNGKKFVNKKVIVTVVSPKEFQ